MSRIISSFASVFARQSDRSCTQVALKSTIEYLHKAAMTSMPMRSIKPVLYADDRSPAVRSVLMLIDELNLKVDVVQVDLFKREQYEENYLKINPQHTVPALHHGDLHLHDSHTILVHLAETFADASNEWLPKAYVDRIKVIDRLFFNGTNLFRRDSDAFTEIFAKQPLDITHHIDKLTKLYNVMEQYLNESTYFASEHLTIADLSIAPTLSTVNMILPVDAIKWPRLAAWFVAMRSRPSYQNHNVPGLKRLHEVLRSVAKCTLYDYNL